MAEQEELKEQIREAFGTVEYPGDWCLRGSHEGHEPFLVERDFKGKTDWRTVAPAFIDQAPDGLASALSFFSGRAAVEEALRNYWIERTARQTPK